MRQILTMMAVVCLAAVLLQPLKAQNFNATPGTGNAMAGLAAETNPPAQYSASELEDLRTQLLNLENTLEIFAAVVPSNAASLDSLQQAKTRIQQLPYQHLNALRRGISPSALNSHVTEARQHLQNAIASRRGAKAANITALSAPQINATINPFPTGTAACQTIGDNLLSIAQTGISSALGSVSGGIQLGQTVPTMSDDTFANDVSPNSTTMRIPPEFILAADIFRFSVDELTDFSQDACKETVLGENLSLVCIAVDALKVVADAVDEMVHFCNDGVTETVVDTTYNGLYVVWGNLTNIGNALDTHLTSANADIDGKITALSAQFTALTQLLNTYINCIKNPGTCANPLTPGPLSTPGDLTSQTPGRR